MNAKLWEHNDTLCIKVSSVLFKIFAIINIKNVLIKFSIHRVDILSWIWFVSFTRSIQPYTPYLNKTFAWSLWLVKWINIITFFLQICLEVFDGGKRKDEHECSLVENTGSAFRCHRHEPPLVFGQKSELEQHLMSHADDTSALLAQRFTCPVCQKVKE